LVQLPPPFGSAPLPETGAGQHFFNNTNNLPRPIYRHNTVGFNPGGPAFLPKLLPRSQQKVFFFYS